MTVDVGLIIANPDLSLMDGALRWYGELRKKAAGWGFRQVESIAAHYGVSLETPWRELPATFRDVLLYGSGDEKIHFRFSNESAGGSWSGEIWRPPKGIGANIPLPFPPTTSAEPL